MIVYCVYVTEFYDNGKVKAWILIMLQMMKLPQSSTIVYKNKAIYQLFCRQSKTIKFYDEVKNKTNSFGGLCN